MITVLNIYYQESVNFPVRGTIEKAKYTALGYISKPYGKNNSFIMILQSNAFLSFVYDGKEYRENVRDLILEYFKGKNLTKNRTQKFYEAIMSGEITLDYVDGSLVIV